MLTFLERGSAFSDEQNCAFFTDGSDLVLTDLSMSGFHKLRRRGMEGTGHIYVLVTHTHSDHVGGIPMLIHYAFYVWHVPVTVGAPSEVVGKQLKTLISELDGCADAAYEIVDAASLKWVKRVILTEHAPSLDGRCFGYQLDIGGRNVIYTGDTSTLEKFLPYIDGDTVLYTEAASRFSGVHLHLEKAIGTLRTLSESGTEIYLMHLDDEDAISAMIEGTDIKLAPLYNR